MKKAKKKKYQLTKKVMKKLKLKMLIIILMIMIMIKNRKKIIKNMMIL